MGDCIDRIFPSFYIGSIQAVNRTVLDDHQITHVLSIMNGYQPKWPKMYKTMVIDVLDAPTVNLSQYFEKTFKFIEEGREEGAVLVHCFAGMSRSASICIAYMMKKLNISYEDAHGLLLERRPIIYPNSGFVYQLKKYEQELLEAKLKSEKKEKKQKDSIQSSPETVQTPPSSTTTTTTTEEIINTVVTEISKEITEISNSTTTTTTVEVDGNEGFRYSCRKCSKDLFIDLDILPHEQGDGQAAFKHHRRDKISKADEQVVCTSYFLMELDFFVNQTSGGVDGRLVCDNPKCGEKIGSWSWSGEQCSCGAWIAPSFQIPKTRVDEKKRLILKQTPDENEKAKLLVKQLLNNTEREEVQS
eukprot:gene10970-13440_t